MVPILILPASMLGFMAAIGRYLMADISLTQAGLTYLAVSLAAPALLLWVLKTVEFFGNRRPLTASDMRTA